MKRERQPTPEEFAKLLLWLDPNRDEAGQKLKVIHTRLIQIFASRGCIDAEALADEVINRVAVRIDEVTKNYPDPLRCCIGFVENVHREYIRERQKQNNVKPPSEPRDSDRKEREDKCLRECMVTLPERERNIFVRYFAGEGKKIAYRKRLAEELELSANALRIQAHRVRKKLLKCMQSCLDQD